MNSLSELRKALQDKGHQISEFNGYRLISSCGTFTLAMEQYYRDGVAISKKELREIIDGKPQASQIKEPTSRVPDVQAAQGKRSKAGKARSSGVGETLRSGESLYSV